MSKSKLFALGPLLAILVAPAAQGQVSIDVSKITCEQYILDKVTDPRFIAIWLSGYYNGKRNNTIVDTQTLQSNASKVTDYCRLNLKMTVMQAVETTLGAGK